MALIVSVRCDRQSTHAKQALSERVGLSCLSRYASGEVTCASLMRLGAQRARGADGRSRQDVTAR